MCQAQTLQYQSHAISDAIVAKAREYIGTPYQHQQRLKGIAVDCAGLAVCVGQELGLSDWDTANYRRVPRETTIIDAMEAAGFERIDKDNACPGDILVFWMSVHSRKPQHIGIKTDIGMVHANGHQGVKRVVEHSIDEYWEKRIICAYRYPEAK